MCPAAAPTSPHSWLLWSRCGGCRGPSLHLAALPWVDLVQLAQKEWRRGGVAKMPLLGEGPAGRRRSEKVLSSSFSGGGGQGGEKGKGDS